MSCDALMDARPYRAAIAHSAPGHHPSHHSRPPNRLTGSATSPSGPVPWGSVSPASRGSPRVFGSAWLGLRSGSALSVSPGLWGWRGSSAAGWSEWSEWSACSVARSAGSVRSWPEWSRPSWSAWVLRWWGLRWLGPGCGIASVRVPSRAERVCWGMPTGSTAPGACRPGASVSGSTSTYLASALCSGRVGPRAAPGSTRSRATGTGSGTARLLSEPGLLSRWSTSERVYADGCAADRTASQRKTFRPRPKGAYRLERFNRSSP